MMPRLVLAACLVFLLLVVPSARGQLFSLGRCPTPPSQPNFDVNSYLGVWYEYSNYFVVYEAFQECIKATYTLNGDNSLQVVNDGRFRLLKIPVSVTGRADADPNDAAKLEVNFGSGTVSAPSTVTPNYQVIETDYTSHAVVFNCEERLGGVFNLQSLWILTRARSGLSDSELSQIFTRLRTYRINPDRLRKTGQDGCTN